MELNKDKDGFKLSDSGENSWKEHWTKKTSILSVCKLKFGGTRNEVAKRPCSLKKSFDVLKEFASIMVKQERDWMDEQTVVSGGE